MFQVRTDLALESKEKFEEDNVEVKGVRVEEEQLAPEIRVTRVYIDTENGARIMGKPKGSYITLEASDMMEENEQQQRKVAMELAKIVKNMMPEQKEQMSVLVVGLGNRHVTPDALGPYVVENMMINRHILQEFGPCALEHPDGKIVSAIVPGVMAQTGMESSEIIAGIIGKTKPGLVVVVDALAARSVRRLNRTIQISDTGINPGSGVGNHRHAINEESVGVPVIAIGVPTVVDAATIVSDTMDELVTAMRQSDTLQSLGASLSTLDDAEKRELVRELLSPNLNAMFVTPKDIDDAVRNLSHTVAEGLNLAFSS
ncbi:MAG: GPR endopeptidase [Lachnospiraceae bacterium]|nr:GPR endopeptidase [Lachnospiraceae bacterium]